MKKLFAPVALISALMIVNLSGCMKSVAGNPSITDQSKVDQIKPGQTTKDQVRQILGQPTNTQFSDNNEEVWFYQYTATSVKPQSYIPVVGIFAAGADTSSSNVTIRYRPDGIVKNIGKGGQSAEASSVVH